MPRTLTRAWPHGLFLLATLGFHVRELSGELPYLRDTHMLFVPAKHFFASEWAQGRLSEWWPWSGLGAPLLAQPLFSFFHPSTLLYGLLPFFQAFVLQDMLATFFVFVGAFALARQWKLPPALAAFAAVSYGLCGYVCGLSEFPFSKWAAGALPLYLASLLWGLSRTKVNGWVPALALALLLLSGDLQLSMWGVALGAVLLLSQEGRPKWGWAGFSTLLGAALSAIQLWPAWKLAPHTERAQAMVEADKWSLGAHHLWGHFLPLDHGPYDFVPSTFMGMAVVSLAFSALWAVRLKKVRVWVAVACVSCLLALGEAGLLTPLFRQVVPFWNQFRYPIKSLLVFELSVSLLAAQALQLGRFRVFRFTAAAAWAAMGTWALMKVGAPAALVGALSLGVLVLAFWKRRLGGALATALLAGQLLSFEPSRRVTTSASFYDEPPLARVLRQQGVGLSGPSFDRVDDSPRRAEDWAWACARGAGGGDCSLNALSQLPTLSPNQPGSSLRLRELIAQNRDEVAFRLAGIFGVGFLVMREPLHEKLQPLVVGRDEASGYAVLRLPRFLPRAYAVQRGQRVGDAPSAVSQVWSAGFLPGREVVLEGRAPGAEPDRPLAPATEARVSRLDFDHVRIEARLPAPGFVVLNEAFFPGWEATVDGVPAPLFIANAAVRAVEAPEGRHVVEMRYRTPGLREGAWVSLGALLLISVMALSRFVSQGVKKPLQKVFGGGHKRT